MPERAATLLSLELLQQLSCVPRLAAQHGKEFTLLNGTEIKYFPVQDLSNLPWRFVEVLRSYQPEHEVLLVGDRDLNRCSWMLSS